MNEKLSKWMRNFKINLNPKTSENNLIKNM